MKTQKIKIFSQSEKQRILNKLNEQFGINELSGTITMLGSERIFLFQGDFTEKQIQKLSNTIPIERTGFYFAKEQNDAIRLSLDAAHLLKEQITKNIFELNQEQAEQWLHGNELNIETNLRGFIILKYKEDLIGTGRASENKITNFIPKNRRLRSKD